MARVIVDAPAGVQVDHRNHDTLDNLRRNLRLATPADNQHNRRTPASRRYAGVHWDRGARKWRVLININGRRRNLGYFDSPVQAAIMRDVFARLYYGEFAQLNFPLAPASNAVRREEPLVAAA